jgi:hypothetical protein
MVNGHMPLNTGYHGHYVELADAQGHLTSFDPLGPSLAVADTNAADLCGREHAIPAGKDQK